MTKKDKMEIPGQAGNDNRGEIVLYQPEGEVKLEVRVENETVWLNRQQMSILFNRDVKTIGKHIANALKEECQNSVVAKFATTAEDGKTYQVEHYDLDLILSIGYRVKSSNGVKFRRWANQVLKDYLLRGYSVNPRMMAVGMQVESRFREQAAKISMVENAVQSQESRLSAVGNEMTAYSVLSFVTPEEVIEKVKESVRKGDSPSSGE